MIVAVLVARGLDVRMVLLLGALPLFAVTGGLPSDGRQGRQRDGQPGDGGSDLFGDGLRLRLRLTECDQHLVGC